MHDRLGDSQRILGTITSTAVYPDVWTSKACDRNPMWTFGGVANTPNSFSLAYLQHIIDGTVVPTTYLCARVLESSLIAHLNKISTITLVYGNYYI
ncbi:hypothetical protein [uncultured Nostoc sp.]|uniref:hypothetical protein n=1 Tax=uncultured Nostoc sp. TaxID=340711 RepID=UPI0035CAAC6A